MIVSSKSCAARPTSSSRAAIAERRPWSVDYRIERADGELKPVSLLKVDGAIAGRPVISADTARAVRRMLEMVVLPGGVDVHTHVAGGALNFARGLVPENQRSARKFLHGLDRRAGLGGMTPTTVCRTPSSVTTTSAPRHWPIRALSSSWPALKDDTTTIRVGMRIAMSMPG